MLELRREDTICALSTALYPAALAIVRVSGVQAHEILERVFSPLRHKDMQDFVATRGDVKDPHTHEILDDAVCIRFPQGKSYTGEAAFELSLHGSPLIAQSVLEALQQAGCRLAQPGEFSRRAVLNGKLDLCAAEAVYDVIHAKSRQAVNAALKSVRGGLGHYLEPVRHGIIDVLCEIEARLDFPDENIGEAHSTQLELRLSDVQTRLERLLRSAQLGQRLTQGARVVLFGAPNAGKSTLLNTLVGEERALVHDRPGTTRDVLEATWLLKGIPVTLIDVAGIREDPDMDPVEAMGIARAKREIESADVVVWLSPAAEQHDPSLEALCSNKTMLKVFSKKDINSVTATNGPDTLCISATTGEGLEDLAHAISRFLLSDAGDAHDEVVLTRVRQKEEVTQALTSLQAAQKALTHHEADEVIASELRACGAALDRLLGTSLNEDVLDLIFSRFCIGK